MHKSRAGRKTPSGSGCLSLALHENGVYPQRLLRHPRGLCQSLFTTFADIQNPDNIRGLMKPFLCIVIVGLFLRTYISAAAVRL
jgi:hypothetical protein